MLIDLYKNEDFEKLEKEMLTYLKNFLGILCEYSKEKYLTKTIKENKDKKDEVVKVLDYEKLEEEQKEELKITGEKKNFFVQRINEYISIFKTEDERIQFINAAIEDLDFTSDIRFKEAPVSFKASANEYKNEIKQLRKIFGSLYTHYFDLETQVKPELTNRKYYYELYFQSNEKICPVCLGSINSKQLDHFFPQAQFPVLSLHPDNITPTCEKCNTSIGEKTSKGKGKNLPIDISLADDLKISLNDIYYPYRKSGHKKVIGKILKNNIFDKEIIPHVVHRAEAEAEKLKRFTKLYNLQPRWSENIYTIHNNIFHSIIGSLQSTLQLLLIDSLSSLKEEHLNNMIKGHLEETYIYNDNDNHVVRFPDKLLESSYVVYLIEDKGAFRAFVDEIKHELKFNSSKVPPYFYNTNLYL